MIRFVTGDLFDSDAYALVNAVNCEGVMGKGIAYQFKERFPFNCRAYQNACATGFVRSGQLYAYEENGKLIISFPTKDKWREPSRMSYIDAGLSSLVTMIQHGGIPSVAIPPLGAGNGGLVWRDVRELMEKRLYSVSQSVDIEIYEPSEAAGRGGRGPRLGVSALVLMDIEERLGTIDKRRVKEAFDAMNKVLPKHKRFVIRDESFDSVYGRVEEFKRYHHISSLPEAKRLLFRTIISGNVVRKMNELTPAIRYGCRLAQVAMDTERDARKGGGV